MTESQRIAQLAEQLAKVSDNLLNLTRSCAFHQAVIFALVKEMDLTNPDVAKRLVASIVESLAPHDEATRAQAEVLVATLPVGKSAGFKPSVIKGGRDTDHDQT